MVTINSYRQPIRYKVALGIAILDVVLILVTLIRNIPRLQPAFLIPFPEVLMDVVSWFTLAEICFYCAMLITIYGFLSLWLPELRFILWFGAGSVVGAGLLYLLAALMSYHEAGMGVPVQQGLFMFILSLSVPIFVVKLNRRHTEVKQ